MDDFGPSDMVPNKIQPGKRPQSSMSPTIMLDKDGKVKMVIGASGGSKIPPAILQVRLYSVWSQPSLHPRAPQVILHVLRFNKTLSDAITCPRLYHRLIPNIAFVEKNFPSEYQEALKSRGHVVDITTPAVVQGIEVIDGLIYATSDPRKGGAPAGY